MVLQHSLMLQSYIHATFPTHVDGLSTPLLGLDPMVCATKCK
jgi:hypothetical protein